MNITKLSKEELWNQFIHSIYPKWSTLCFLKYLEYNILPAYLLEPNIKSTELENIVIDFANSIRSNQLLIRTDGGKEIGSYPKGGNSLTVENVLPFVQNILSNNRAVILMKPTNRFTNKLAINFLLDKSGSLIIDILGPGFDVSDLNRGIISPEISISIDHVNWYQFEKPHPLFIKIKTTTNKEKLISQRLFRIGTELLPAIGIKLNEPILESAEKWLITNQFTELLHKATVTVTYKKILHWYEDLLYLGMLYNLKMSWKNLVISASNLDKELTYWDISNPTEKFLIK